MDDRQEPGKGRAAFFAVLVHALFVLVLVYGVTWQTHEETPVSVDLWRGFTAPQPSKMEAQVAQAAKQAEAQAQAEEAKQAAEAKAEAARQAAEQEKAAQAAKQAAQAAEQAKAEQEAEIRLKARKKKQEEAKKAAAAKAAAEAKREAAAKAAAEAKREAAAKAAEAKREADLKRQQAAKAAELKKQQEKAAALKLQKEKAAAAAKQKQEALRERQLAEDWQKKMLDQEVGALKQADAARQQAALDGKTLNEYLAKIRNKIRRNTSLPPDISGNPAVVFKVKLLPSGAVIGVQLVKSSGDKAYDEAVQRGIYKADPLPVPDSPALFSQFRSFTLKYRPQEE